MARISTYDNGNNTIIMANDVESYKGLLKSLQDTVVVLETKKDLDQVHVWDIDLDSRKITPPAEFKDYLGVVGEHKAETLTFRCARYYDGVDLAFTTIVVEYVNANKEGRICPIIVKDFTTFDDEIIFDWTVDAGLLKAPGDIQFAIRFFKIGDEEKYVDSVTGKVDTYYRLVYSLRTRPYTSRIVGTLPLDTEEYEAEYANAMGSDYQVLMGAFEALSQQIEEKELLWRDIT